MSSKRKTEIGGHPRRCSGAGFALIAALGIMSFLVLLGVALFSLASVSLNVAEQATARVQARANAKVALAVALGELQENLGPDQRISMVADQRTDPDGDGSTPSAAEGNRHWTGVYQSWLSATEDRPPSSGHFRAWLVSGEPSFISQEVAADTSILGSDTIELVGSGTVGPDADEKHVVVPLMDVSDGANRQGRFAWWVGDQGVKAALAPTPPATESSLPSIRNNLQSAPRNAVELLTLANGETQPFEDLEPDDPRLPKVTNWQQVAFLATDPTGPQPLFHDLATFSSGLLTNVRAGGFRKDLSMKLETYSGAPDLTDPGNVLYTVESDVTGNNEVGINFMELWAYYQLYRELDYTGGLDYTTGDSVPSDTPLLQTENTEGGIENDPWDRFKHPITISYQVIFSLEVAPHPDEDDQDVLWLNFDPVVTLWNPLDVAVDVPELTDKNDRNYLYSFWMIPYDLNVSINGNPEIVCSILETSNYKGDANFLRLNAGKAEQLTLKPGEVVKISQAGDTVTRNRGQGIGGWQGLNGVKGFNYGGGVRQPLRDYNEDYIPVDSVDTISYRLTPNDMASGGQGTGNSGRFALNMITLGSGGRGGLNQGLMSIDHRRGYARVQPGETSADSTNPFDIVANDGDKYEEVFPVIEGPVMTRVLNAGSLMNDKATIMVWSYLAKTEEENKSGSKMFARFNPRAFSLNFYDLSKEERDMMPFEPEIAPLLSWLDAPLDESTSGQGYYGSSLSSSFGSNFVITHSVPRQPIVSLAALQDSFANGFNQATKANTDRAAMSYPLQPQISHAIGNSLAPSVIPPDQVKSSTFETGGSFDYAYPLADHAYLANRELWDDYFFSGITPRITPVFPDDKKQEAVAREFFEDELALPVARYLPVREVENIDDLLDDFFDNEIPTEEAVSGIARYLNVDGMFNINSTSVEAWKALLGALRNQELVVMDELGDERIIESDEETPVAQIGASRDVITTDASTMASDQWYGRRTLSDEEIGELAGAIVKEVRKRGPFLSLADFVNRRVGNDTELARSGAIQSALDADEVSINEEQNSTRSVADSVADRFEFPEAEKGAMHYGAPSLVKQADILTPIAPILSARSDSFIIRAYGEVAVGEGESVQAWCEAVVQRGHDYVNPTDDAARLPADLTEPVNRTFGRKFKIVSFRWLNPQEI